MLPILAALGGMAAKALPWIGKNILPQAAASLLSGMGGGGQEQAALQGNQMQDMNQAKAPINLMGFPSTQAISEAIARLYRQGG